MEELKQTICASETAQDCDESEKIKQDESFKGIFDITLLAVSRERRPEVVKISERWEEIKRTYAVVPYEQRVRIVADFYGIILSIVVEANYITRKKNLR